MILLPDISYSSLRDMVDYIYSGYTCLREDKLATFLSFAAGLEIGGLVKTETEEMEPQDLSVRKRRREEEEEDSDNNACLSSYVENVNGRSLSYPKPGKRKKIVESTNIYSGIFQDNLNNLCEESKAKLKKPKLKETSKVPTWSQTQLQEAIESVITQKLRFTQASSQYGIPKGTLYDNILGKSKRMVVLEQVGLTDTQELSVLEFCCEISSMPYNRRTSRSLRDVIQFIACLKKEAGEKDFTLSMRQGFKWWWAFTKKHNIISLYYEEENKSKQNHPSKVSDPPRSQSSSPENLLNLLNNPSSVPINIPTSSLPLLPFLGLNSHSKYSLKHPDFILPPRAHANITL